MRRIRIVTGVLAAVLLVPGVAAAKPAPATLSDALAARLQETAATVETLSSDLLQEKHLNMFKTAVTSRGRFYYRKPDQLRWEIASPSASGFVLNGNRGKRWNGRTGRTEALDIGSDPVMKVVADQLFSWARADMARLKKEYRITVLEEAPVSLRLEPLSPAAGFVKHLLITFSVDGGYVRTVEVHEKDGDFTRIKFLNTAVNKPLKADLF